MITYIIESQGHYKIGKTKDLESRLKSFNTHCFDFKITKLIFADIEAILHTKFENQRVKLEWFSLTKEDIESIDAIVLALDNVDSCDYDISWNVPIGIGGKRTVTSETRAILSAAAKKRGKANYQKKTALINENGEILKVFDTLKEAAESIGKSPGVVKSSCKDRKPTSTGHRFAFIP